MLLMADVNGIQVFLLRMIIQKPIINYVNSVSKYKNSLNVQKSNKN